MNNPSVSEKFDIDHREKVILNLFWIGFIIYTSAFALSTTTQVNYVVCNILQVLGMFIFIPSAFLLIRFKIENSYLRTLFILYCLWIAGVIIRGFLFDYDFIKLMLFNAYESVFIYLAPLILLFPKKLHYIKILFNVIIVAGLIYVAFDLIFIKNLLINYDIKNSQAIVEYFSKTLSIPCGFVLLTYIYHSRNRNFIALSLIILTFLLALIRARRGLAFMAMCPLVASYFVYWVYSNNKSLKLVFPLGLFILMAAGIAYSQSIITFLGENSTTSWFLDRLTQDTRNEVEQYFYMDLKPRDWAIGKGINGQYYCPGVVDGEGRVSIFRRGIETDYLTIILKGGIISLALMMLISVPAIIKGLFTSKNMLSKAAAIWILFYLIDLYPVPVTTFTLNYLMVWISIGICYSEEISNLSDSEITDYFRYKAEAISHSP